MKQKPKKVKTVSIFPFRTQLSGKAYLNAIKKYGSGIIGSGIIIIE